MDRFSVTGKVIVLTGGGGHIVGAMVRDLAEQGAHCVSADLRREKVLPQENGIDGVVSEYLDVTNKAEWTNLLERVMDKFGRIDALVNGAGINAPSSFLGVDIDEMKQIMDVNFIGTVLGCQVLGAQMVRANRGSIVNISSTSADPPLSRAFAYSASKAAVTNITKNIAREWGPTGVRVNALRPGFFPTEWNKKNFLTDDRIADILRHTPMSRFGDPQELCGAAQWLISDASSFVTGSEVIVDGGFSCQTI